MITQSKRAAASVRILRILADDSPLVGSESGAPPGNTVSVEVNGISFSFSSVGARSASLRPRSRSSPVRAPIDGRCKSASISKTRRRYEPLRIRAKLIAVSVFPSAGDALVTMRIRAPSAACTLCKTAPRRRYCSANHGLQPTSDTSRSPHDARSDGKFGRSAKRSTGSTSGRELTRGLASAAATSARSTSGHADAKWR